MLRDVSEEREGYQWRGLRDIPQGGLDKALGVLRLCVDCFG